jgi:hypothetical protein
VGVSDLYFTLEHLNTHLFRVNIRSEFGLPMRRQRDSGHLHEIFIVLLGNEMKGGVPFIESNMGHLVAVRSKRQFTEISPRELT